MRAFTGPSKRTAAPTVKKTWQWNSAIQVEEETRAKEVQDAQRRFRNSI